MTLLRRALQAVTKAHDIDRPPLAVAAALLNGGFGAQTGITAQLDSMVTVGWLFGTIDRIATAVAATEWQLFSVQSDGDRKEIFKHPLLDLWNTVNPFETREGFLEASDQHFELVGEMWWLILRNGMGTPQELWLIRPDRMRPVPSPEEFLVGYIYTIGEEKIPIVLEDVMFTKRPSPTNPYRGIGVVQSVLTDIQSERMSALWTRNFYTNNAEPGGIIEVEEAMSDTDFLKFVDRWRTQHQGIGNAHRVAVLEKARWVDRKLTQRDMQAVQQRDLNRDVILGAFGMPKSVMGITESVNRANAEAGEVLFSRWLVVPRLRRIRAVLNSRLAPMFGPNLQFDFTDPTPENRELNLREAVEGYTARVLTQNESRARLGEGEVDGGDQFAPQPLALSLRSASGGLGPERLKVLDNPLREDEVNEEEDSIESGWNKRLAAEREALVEFLEEFA